MKALLSQWIGSLKQGTLSAQQTGSDEKIADTVDAETHPFMGLMMGFLGMGKNAEGSAEKAAMINNQGELTVGDKFGQISILGKEILSDSSATAETKVEAKTAAGEESGSDNTNSSANNVEGHKQQMELGAADASKLAGTDSRSSANSAIAAGEDAKQGQPNLTHVDQTPTDEAVKNEQASTNISQTRQVGKKTSLNAAVKNTTSNTNAGNNTPLKSEGNQQVADGELQSTLNNTTQNGLSGSDKMTKKMGLNAENSAKESMPNSKNGLSNVTGSDREPQRNSLESEARLKQAFQKEINNKTAAKKDTQTTIKEFKAMQKEIGDAKARAGQNTQSPGRDAKPQTMAKSAQNAGSSSFKSESSAAKMMPGNMVVGQSSNTIDIEMDMDTPQEFKGGSDNVFKEIQMNDLKSTQFGDASGRKSFSRQLVQASRQQLSQQTRTSSQETAQWKHHRFMLEDGKAIHVAARTTDGALQLQLNAGNGELSKMLHQHLQDIQQHVQQELKIKIDLQLQNFSGQQPNQQGETSNGGEQTTPHQTLGGGASSTDNGLSSGSRQVRYFGFNSNEWTA